MSRLARGVSSLVPAIALVAGLLGHAPANAGSSSWPCQWGMYGGSAARTFSTDCSGISRLNVGSLVPAWTPFKTAGTVTASPAVVDGRLYVGDWTGTMYALDAATGKEVWKTQTNDAPGAAFGPIVSSAAVADVTIGSSTRRLVVFGSGPRLYALDAHDGSVFWVTDFGKTPNPNDPDDEADPTEIESSPVIWQGRIYVGIDTHDRPAAQAFGRSGGLLVVNAADGSLLWKFDPELGIKTDNDGNPLSVSEPALYPYRTGCGGVWSSPALDVATATVYFATANCQSDHPNAWDSPHAEAVTALDATTGAVKWTFGPHDPYNHLDWDFGATPNLFSDAAGRTIVGAGNKDGRYYALDATTGSPTVEPAVLWSSHVSYGDAFGEDFAIGGFIGSPAVARIGSGTDQRVYVVGGTAIGRPIGEEGIKGYYHARDAADGSNPWTDPITGEIPTGGVGGPSYAASAAVNGVVFSGALDNLFKAYDAETGAILWTTTLLGPISSGPAIVGDTVYVGSGTSSSDLCAKDQPGSEACFLFFDSLLGSTGGIHAFRMPLPHTT